MEMLWPELTEFPRFSADEAHVFAVPLDGIGASQRELLSILSAEERQRAERFQLDQSRWQFIAGRAALRKLLGRYLDVPPAEIVLMSDARGKPRLGNAGGASEPRFNVAHSDELCLVAVTAGCAVGVDVEHVRPVSHLEQIARRYFHAAEIERIQSAPPESRAKTFLYCWTGKEAVLKAIGSGLVDSLSAFHVPTEDHGGVWVTVPAATAGTPARLWLQALAPCRGYVAAAASVGALRHFHGFTLRL